MLINALCISEDILRRWKIAGLITPHTNGYFDSETIDNFLAHCFHTFPSPPTISHLLKGKIPLIKPPEAIKRLGLKGHSGWQCHVENRKLHAILMGSSWRFSEICVEQYRHMLLDPNLLSRRVVGHVIGQPGATVQHLIDARRLECTPLPTLNASKPVTRTSLIKLLGELLPDWIDPWDWLGERLAEDRDLAFFTHVHKKLQLSRSALHNLLQSRCLRYIKSAGNWNILIAPGSIEDYFGLSLKVE